MAAAPISPARRTSPSATPRPDRASSTANVAISRSGSSAAAASRARAAPSEPSSPTRSGPLATASRSVVRMRRGTTSTGTREACAA